MLALVGGVAVVVCSVIMEPTVVALLLLAAAASLLPASPVAAAFAVAAALALECLRARAAAPPEPERVGAVGASCGRAAAESSAGTRGGAEATSAPDAAGVPTPGAAAVAPSATAGDAGSTPVADVTDVAAAEAAGPHRAAAPAAAPSQRRSAAVAAPAAAAPRGAAAPAAGRAGAAALSVLAAARVVFMAHACSPSAEWTHEHSGGRGDSALLVESRPAEGSKYRVFRASWLVRGRPLEVALALDTPARSQWDPQYDPSSRALEVLYQRGVLGEPGLVASVVRARVRE
jgi:hypothetical protein